MTMSEGELQPLNKAVDELSDAAVNMQPSAQNSQEVLAVS